MSTRLTPEREAELRRFAEFAPQYPTRELLSEIDALREERERLVDAAREARWILPLVEAAGKQPDAAKRAQIIRRVQSAHEGLRDAMKAFPLLSEDEEYSQTPEERE